MNREGEVPQRTDRVASLVCSENISLEHAIFGEQIDVKGGETAVPSIDLNVNFVFDSARLNNESLLTLDVLGRAIASEELKGQAIEIVGHTDAKGTLEYNHALSQRRAAAVWRYSRLLSVRRGHLRGQVCFLPRVDAATIPVEVVVTEVVEAKGGVVGQPAVCVEAEDHDPS